VVKLREGSCVDGGAEVGDKAREFELPSADARLVSLRDFLGSKTGVLYFYPKDETLGCTREACAFRDNYEVFKEMGVE